jgi:hypothetical protein
MKVKFRTLTPIFTGDRFTNQSHQLRETGLLGSLRFWGQAITRGLGYKVTGDDGKKVEIKSFDDIYKKLDANTRTFGCTDWKKIFQMEIIQPDSKKSLMQNEAHVLAKKHGWTLKPGLFFPWNEPIQINFSTRPFKDEHKWIRDRGLGWLALIWHIIDRLCGIGAHQGWGYGQIRLVNKLTIMLEEGEAEKHLSPDLPDLADFVFAEYEFLPKTKVVLNPLGGEKDYFKRGKGLIFDPSKTPASPGPVGLSLRYLLHYGNPARYVSSIKWRDSFFGGMGKGNPAGRFHASFMYRVDNKGNPDPKGDRFRFRMWAWLPKSLFQDKEANGMPDWCSAAQMLRDELRNKSLWKEVASCNPPQERYFWPLTRSTGHPELGTLSTILSIIEDRAKNMLGRGCI